MRDWNQQKIFPKIYAASHFDNHMIVYYLSILHAGNGGLLIIKNGSFGPILKWGEGSPIMFRL